MSDRIADRPRWTWYAAWQLVGGGFVLAVLAALSIGVYLLPFVAVGFVALLRQPERRLGWPGAISGMGWPLLFIAYTNRHGPADWRCTRTATSEICGQVLDPRPWLGLGITLLVIGLIEFVRRRRGPALPSTSERSASTQRSTT